MSSAKTNSAPPAERKPKFSTLSGLPVDPVYARESLGTWDPETELGYPGEFPYTRGIYPTMYRGRFWTMRQYAGFGTAVESNRRYRYLLSKGQAGLSVAFDLPTQIGLDSDHALALGEVGKVGVAIDSLEDMETLFDGIPLEQVSTSMTINATAAILLCLYVAVAKKQGASLGKLSGTVQNDVLKEYIARGTYIYPVRPAMRIVTDIFAWCRDHLPRWNTISISGYHIREAGSTAVQEVAFTLADGIAYVESALIALRTQQIIAQETGVTNTIDPVAGSYAIEHLTGEIERRAEDYIAKIDALGGMLRAIETGFVQAEIQKVAFEFQRAVEKKEQIVVGVNDFIGEEARQIPTLRIDEEIERSQIEIGRASCRERV